MLYNKLTPDLISVTLLIIDTIIVMPILTQFYFATCKCLQHDLCHIKIAVNSAAINKNTQRGTYMLEYVCTVFSLKMQLHQRRRQKNLTTKKLILKKLPKHKSGLCVIH